jgi:hypothetical protein
MKLKDSFILEKIDDSFLVIPTDSTLLDVGAMITLNETSALIWQELEKGSDEKSIAKKLASEYNVDKETAFNDVSEFINILKEKNFLEE